MAKLKVRETYGHSESRNVHASIKSEWGKKPMFTKIVTIDPNLTQDAWDQLCINTRAVEYQELPQTLHTNFVRALFGKRVKERLFG